MDWMEFQHGGRVVWLLAVAVMVAFVIWRMVSLGGRLGAFVG